MGLIALQDGDDHHFLDTQITRHALKFIANLLGRAHNIRGHSPPPRTRESAPKARSPVPRWPLGRRHRKAFAMEANAANVQFRAGVEALCFGLVSAQIIPSATIARGWLRRFDAGIRAIIFQRR